MAQTGVTQRFKLLVLSRDDDMLKRLSEALRRQGCQVVPVNNANAALKALETAGFAGAVMDLRRAAISAVGLLRALYGAEGTRELPLIFIAPSEVPQKDLEPLATGGNQVIALPEDPDELMLKISMAVSKLRAKTKERAVSFGLRDLAGDVDYFPLAEIFQLIQQGRRTGALHLTHQGHDGRLYFVRGEVHHAEMADFEPEEALRLLLRVRHGRFEFHKGEIVGQRTLTTSSTGLLIDTLRKMDETRALIEEYTEARDRRRATRSPDDDNDAPTT